MSVGGTARTGGVRSILIVSDAVFVSPAPLVAEQVNVDPAEPLVRVVVPHPAEEDAIPDTGSVTLQLAVTLLTYQPLLPNVPVICGAMTGGVASIINDWAGWGISAFPAWLTL